MYSMWKIVRVYFDISGYFRVYSCIVNNIVIEKEEKWYIE